MRSAHRLSAHRPAFTPISADVSITADTRVDRRDRPYICVSINYGDQRLYLVPRRGTRLYPDGEFHVLRRSPLESKRARRLTTKKA
jgi:hypothetical protein